MILNAIKKHYKFKSDAEFARFLGIKPNSLSNWYTRNTMDYERVFSKCVEIDGNWLLSGQGQMLRSQNNVTGETHLSGLNNTVKEDIDWKEKFHALTEEYNNTLKKYNALLEDKSTGQAS